MTTREVSDLSMYDIRLPKRAGTVYECESVEEFDEIREKFPGSNTNKRTLTVIVYH